MDLISDTDIRYFPPEYNLRLSVLSREKYHGDVIFVLANEVQQNVEIKLTSTTQSLIKYEYEQENNRNTLKV